MKINEAKNNSSATNNGTANNANLVTADKNKVAFVNSNPVNTVSKPKDEKDTQAEQPKKDVPTVEQPKAEQPKAEVKAEPFKPVMNLDSTVKVVLDLNRKIQYRNRMQTIVANLDDFVVKQEEVGEEQVPTACRVVNCLSGTTRGALSARRTQT